jgi:hypothetical protein
MAYLCDLNRAAFGASALTQSPPANQRKKIQMKYRTYKLSTLLAFVALGGAQAWAQSNSISSVAITTGVVNVQPRMGPTAPTPNDTVVINNNLAGLAYVAGDLSLLGGPTSIGFYALSADTIPLAGGAADVFVGYGTITGTPTPRTTYEGIPVPALAAKFTPNSYSGLTFTEANLALPSSRQFYTIHHGLDGGGAAADYLSTIVPRSGAASSVVDLKPMSWNGVGTGGPASSGASGYFALAYGDFAGNWIYYLRTESGVDTNPGHIQFGVLIPALTSGFTEPAAWDLNTAIGSFGVTGFTGLVYSPSSLGGIPVNQFYYLRQDKSVSAGGTGYTILGRINPSQVAGTRIVSDIANLGGVYTTITFAVEQTGTATGGGVVWGNTQLYASGSRAATAQSVSFAAIANQQTGVPFTVNPTASSTGTITLSVVAGTATIDFPIGGVSGTFTVTPTSPGVITLKALQPGSGSVLTNWMQQSFNSFGTTLVIPSQTVTLNVAAASFIPVTAAGGTGAVVLSVTGLNALPAGLALNAATGAITGTPTVLFGPLGITITATDSATPALTSSKTFTLTVNNQTTPVVAWATPAAITYGTALSATQLNATSVAGTFVYTPAVGTVLAAGTQTLNVAFTPTDPVTYNSATGSVTLTVNQAPLTITALGQSRAFGAANPAFTTTISGFTNGENLASSGVVGTAGVSTTAILTSPVGTYPITPGVGSLTASNYAFTTFTAGTLTVGQTAQVITFGALSATTFGVAPFAVSATASSGLTVTFSVLSGPASISGSNVTITGAGSVTVRASQVGNNNYSAATAVDQAFTVGQAAQTITFGALGAKTFGVAPFAVSATASSGLTDAFSVLSGPATISGVNVTLTGVGTVTIRASQVGNTNYTAATPVDQAFVVSKGTATVTLGGLSQSFSGSALSATATTSPSGLTVAFTYNGSATAPTAVGGYAVTGTITDNNYNGSASGTLTITTFGGAPVITNLPLTTFGTVGTPFAFAITASGSPTLYGANGLPAGLTINTSTGRITGTPLTLGTYSVLLGAASSTSGGTGNAVLTISIGPGIASQPANTTSAQGGSTTFSVGANGGSAVTYQWLKDGVILSGATNASLVFGSVQSGNIGFYSVIVSSGGTTTTTTPALLEMSFPGQISGSAAVVAAGVHHPNGNIYDQVLLTGPSGSMKAIPGQIVRMSFVDLTDDIVQVELSGAGTLTLNLDSASGPAAAIKYNQPGVTYMKGHASITVTGANGTTTLSIYSVGRGNAVDQSLFQTGTIYDGWADIGVVSIASVDGNFAALRTANANYFGVNGRIGVYAPGVLFSGAVYVGDIDAASGANAVLMLGSVADARITGGNMFQDNGGSVEVSGITRLQYTAGTSSGGALLIEPTNRGRFTTKGVDVTAQIVVQ